MMTPAFLRLVARLLLLPLVMVSARAVAAGTRPNIVIILADDLAQRRNLYGEQPGVVRRLKALLQKYKAAGRSTPGPAIKDPPASE